MIKDLLSKSLRLQSDTVSDPADPLASSHEQCPSMKPSTRTRNQVTYEEESSWYSWGSLDFYLWCSVNQYLVVVPF